MHVLSHMYFILFVHFVRFCYWLWTWDRMIPESTNNPLKWLEILHGSIHWWYAVCLATETHVASVFSLTSVTVPSKGTTNPSWSASLHCPLLGIIGHDNIDNMCHEVVMFRCSCADKPNNIWWHRSHEERRCSKIERERVGEREGRREWRDRVREWERKRKTNRERETMGEEER